MTRRPATFSTMFAGVSLAALAAFISPAAAAGASSLPLSGNYDFVLLDNYAGAGITNDAVIGAPQNHVGVKVINHSSVGPLINNDEIYGSYSDNSTATGVAGIYVDETSLLAGGISNFGSVSAYAHAGVTDVAYAEADGIDYSITTNSSSTADVRNGSDLDSSAIVFAQAFAHAYTSASAEAGGISEDVNGMFGTAYVENDGVIAAFASASAVYDAAADANATATGVWQQVSATQDGTATVNNDGVIGATVVATAGSYGQGNDGDASAYGLVLGVGQQVSAGQEAHAAVMNGTSDMIYASGTAQATGYASADASIFGIGIYQEALTGNDGWLVVENHGTVHADISAFAYGDYYGEANAQATGAGVAQVLLASDDTHVMIANYDEISIGIHASATGEDANAVSIGFAAAQLSASLYDEGHADIVNDGLIYAGVFATASSLYDSAASQAIAGGTLQVAAAAFDRAVTTLTNESGSVIAAVGVARATAYDSASADAYVIGAAQVSLSGTGTAVTDLVNDGVIGAGAVAFASASHTAYAEGDAAGVDQLLISVLDESAATLDNNAAILAGALVIATAYDEAYARAGAIGVNQYGAAVGTVSELVDNSGMLMSGAVAAANATGTADADAAASGVVQLAGTVDEIDITANNSGLLGAVSIARAAGTAIDSGLAEIARATVTATAVQQGGIALIHDANSHVENDEGYLLAFGAAYASATDAAYASASAVGIDQNFTAFIGDINASVENDGTIRVDGYARAVSNSGNSGAEADGTAVGINQRAYDTLTGDASVDVDNSDWIYVLGRAFASAASTATADAEAVGVSQWSESGLQSAYANVENSWVIAAEAGSFAYSSDEDAFASAAGLAISQFADANGAGIAVASITNQSSSLINATGDAVAYASALASADASAVGVEQDVFASLNDATATLTNMGFIAATATAHAAGTQDVYLAASSAFANADATAIDQYASAGDPGPGEDATVWVDNSGSIGLKIISASALASATGYSEATGSAHALGITQVAWAEEDAVARVTNDGDIYATAFARASIVSSIDGTAGAYASATGVSQTLSGGDSSTGTFHNSGGVIATAWAVAEGPESYAEAISFGNQMHFLDADGISIDASNAAGALVSASAEAYAENVQALAAASWFDGPDLYGSIVNHGTIAAFASAHGETGYATALGVVEVSNGTNNVTLSSSGLVGVLATGPNASAIAIAVASYGRDGAPPVGGAPAVWSTISNNGGAIWAGVLDNEDDTTVSRGTAIDTTGFTSNTQNGSLPGGGTGYGAAPNAVLISLMGNSDGGAGKSFVTANQFLHEEVRTALDDYDNYGFVYGNININSADRIEVSDGVTVFDGVINPGGPGVGTLDIQTDGKLVMVQNDEDGPSAANIGSLNVDGVLVHEFTTDDDPGAYPTITADQATLGNGSTFVALYDAGLYGDSVNYDNVIDANTLTGQFGEVVDNSALLNTQVRYDDGNNVDIYAERIHFDAVEGLTHNQAAAGSGIEHVYGLLGPTPTTDFEKLVARMFTLNNADYPEFLNQLSGAEHAQHLQSVLWSTRALNRVVTARMECADDATPAASGSGQQASGAGGTAEASMSGSATPMQSTGCFKPGKLSLWMRGFGQMNEMASDENAPGGTESQYGVTFGGDYAFDEAVFMGIAGTYLNSSGDFDSWGGRDGSSIDYNGFQGTVYGGYDNGERYLRGIVGYGNYDGTSHRLISFNGSAIDPDGKSTSNTMSFYGETGYRIGAGSVAHVTPFAGVSVATATLDGFTEDDPGHTGAALDVHGGTGASIASVLGLRFASEVLLGKGLFSPSVAVSWMHEFGDTSQKVDMAFAGAPAGSDFTVSSAETARDAVLVDAGATYAISGTVDVGVFYSGQFNADYRSNALTARIDYKF